MEFLDEFDERLAKEDKGPRDAAVKDILRKLLTYDSFEDFGFMMKLRCKEIENNEVCDADYLSSTLQREKDNEKPKTSQKEKKSQGAQYLLEQVLDSEDLGQIPVRPGEATE